MFFRIRSQQDFWAALMFATIACIFLWQSTDLTLGTAGRMGPAYMPRLLCGLMLVVAVVLFVRSFRFDNSESVRLSLRPLLVIPGAMVLFALTLHLLGLVLAVCLAVVFASFSDRGARPLEVALSALFLSIFSVTVFVYGLKLNLPIWPVV